MTGPAGIPLSPQVGGDRPRLAVLDRLELTTPLDPYLALRALASYCGCSVKWLRLRLADPVYPLPCYRVGGKILVRRSEFDAWIRAVSPGGGCRGRAAAP